MAETDILNPTNWQTTLDFNPNPSYGFSRKEGSNRQLQRPRMGTFITRDVVNGGNVFSLQWIGIPLSIVQRIKQLYHSYKNGYLTLIDVDAGGRNYVGRFTNEPEANHTANGKYNIQGLIFEEVPLARMLQYPNDWTNGHTINVLDDFLNPLVAFMQGTWITQISPVAPAGSAANDPSVYECYNAAAVSGDAAQIGYVGWGFQMTLRLAAGLGLCCIYLDGAELVTDLNLTTGAYAAIAAPATLVVTETSVQLTATNVPLNLHRLGLVVSASNTGPTHMIFPPVTFIY
jgi:hypothetical protein